MKTKGGIAVPDDLAAALEGNAELLTMWERLRPSCQRAHVASVLDAKRPETRARRVAAVRAATREWNRRHACSELLSETAKRIMDQHDETFRKLAQPDD